MSKAQSTVHILLLTTHIKWGKWICIRDRNIFQNTGQLMKEDM